MISWTTGHTDNSEVYEKARVGNVKILCFSDAPWWHWPRWRARVEVGSVHTTVRVGPKRNCVEQAKNDAIRMANEILSDIAEIVDEETRRFNKTVAGIEYTPAVRGL